MLQNHIETVMKGVLKRLISNFSKETSFANSVILLK